MHLLNLRQGVWKQQQQDGDDDVVESSHQKSHIWEPPHRLSIDSMSMLIHLSLSSGSPALCQLPAWVPFC